MMEDTTMTLTQEETPQNELEILFEDHAVYSGTVTDSLVLE